MNIQTCSMPYLRLFLGFLALAVSFYFSMLFISASASGAGLIAAICFVIVTEFTKSIYTSDIVYYSKMGQGDKAAFSGMIAIVLFILSITASVYFLIISPAKDYTQLDNATTKSTDLDKSIAAKRAQIANCPRNYITKCIRPLTNELNALEVTKRTALASQGDFSEIQANREFWEKSAEMLGLEANELEMYFALLRGILLEILGLALVAQGMTYFKINFGSGGDTGAAIESNRPAQVDHSSDITAIQQQLAALLEKKD